MRSYQATITEILKRFFIEFREIDNEKIKIYYDWAYCVILTRAFEWQVPSLSLVPIGDLINHSENAICHCFVDLEYEIN